MARRPRIRDAGHCHRNAGETFSNSRLCFVLQWRAGHLSATQAEAVANAASTTSQAYARRLGEAISRRCIHR